MCWKLDCCGIFGVWDEFSYRRPVVDVVMEKGYGEGRFGGAGEVICRKGPELYVSSPPLVSLFSIIDNNIVFLGVLLANRSCVMALLATNTMFIGRDRALAENA